MSKLISVPVVYLAGGMRGAWQDKVKDACPGLLFIDPRDHKVKHEAGYTAWDLTGVQRCDIVFGFLEKDNPGGAGLALEFGVATALGKHILFVQEPDHPGERYFGMVRSVSDSVFKDLDAGIQQLQCITGLLRKCGQFATDAVPALRI